LICRSTHRKGKQITKQCEGTGWRHHLHEAQPFAVAHLLAASARFGDALLRERLQRLEEEE
jgi:hypothetical protein